MQKYKQTCSRAAGRSCIYCICKSCKYKPHMERISCFCNTAESIHAYSDQICETGAGRASLGTGCVQNYCLFFLRNGFYLVAVFLFCFYVDMPLKCLQFVEEAELVLCDGSVTDPI